MKIIIDIPEARYKDIQRIADVQQSRKHFSTAEQIISNGMPLKQEPCEDCISRQAVLDLAKSGKLVSNGNYKSVCDAINGLPSVEPERKPGHWEWDQRTGEYVCSECGCNPIYDRTTPDVSEIDKYRYCRWCGAPMEVDGCRKSMWH